MDGWMSGSNLKSSSGCLQQERRRLKWTVSDMFGHTVEEEEEEEEEVCTEHARSRSWAPLRRRGGVQIPLIDDELPASGGQRTHQPPLLSLPLPRSSPALLISTPHPLLGVLICSQLSSHLARLPFGLINLE